MTKFIELGPNAQDMTGKTFGRLVALGPIRRETRSYGSILIWRCRCACGIEIDAISTTLRSGHTSSCGCHKREAAAAQGRAMRKHGKTFSPEWTSWTQIKKRCTNPRDHAYSRYGGRGISICDRWVESFEAFLADVGPRPTPLHSIDRYPDNDGNYEPGNVRWATALEQAHNKRNNLIVSFDGRSGPLASFFDGGVSHPGYLHAWRALRKGLSADEAIALGRAV